MELSERKNRSFARCRKLHTDRRTCGLQSHCGQRGLKVSSATIRNEMAELETLGYLEQPHTSAGRIPSPKGYRLYVNELMEEHG